MPICPRCNATIHTGAREQCPACGYSLALQERVFGKSDVTFPRVKDVAGVLTQQERESLMRYLADLERYIPPVALCIYLTNHGQSQEFRSHAHWILNHARIHTPSFGQREARRAIEDAELRELSPEERRSEREAVPQEGAMTRFCRWLKEKYHQHFSKCPPPVRHEWMLILVVDVQLKLACFSWGYMLDPYINPDKINSCITAARLQFRERARVSALQIVMKKAAKQLASNARRINRDIRKGKRIISPLLAGALGLSLFCASPVCWAKRAASPRPASRPAAQTTPKPPAVPDLEDDVVAVDDEEEDVAIDDEAGASPAAAPAPARPAAQPQPGAPAGYGNVPAWQDGDHRRLMAGELTTCYSTLLPGGKPRPAQVRRSNGKPAAPVRVHRQYCDEYNRASDSGLCDPQGLLSPEERADAEFVLREINAGSNFRIYVAVFQAGQEIPQELNPAALAAATAKPDEHAAVILYSIGDTPEIQIGYREISPDDNQRRVWLLNTQTAATQAGGGFNGILAAARCLKEQILPVSHDFLPLDAQAGQKLPLIPLEFNHEEEEKETSMHDQLRAWLENPENQNTLITGGISAVAALLTGLWLLVRRRVVRLMDTTPDVRLASPHGAGVSRYVRYLDGKEASKDAPLF